MPPLSPSSSQAVPPLSPVPPFSAGPFGPSAVPVSKSTPAAPVHHRTAQEISEDDYRESIWKVRRAVGDDEINTAKMPRDLSRPIDKCGMRGGVKG